MKKIIMKLCMLALAMGSAHVAFAHSDKAVPCVTVNFTEGSAMLSQSDKDALAGLIARADKRGMSTDRVAIAAWSDKTLPMPGEKLMDTDRQLAEDRADAIASYLKTNQDVATVDTYNMAETSNWLARTFNTKDAELKSVFSKRMSAAPINNSEFKTIKQEGAPSSAVVIIEHAM